MGADPLDPRWTLHFQGYDPEDERRREALFALGNGVFVTRAAVPDAVADDRHYPGLYRAGGYGRATAEIAGERVEIETLVNLPNWLVLDVRIEDGPWLSLDAAEIEDYRHTLDLKTGVTRREAVLRDSTGRLTRLREVRLVSMAQPGLMGLKLSLTPLDWSGRVVIRSGLDAGVRNTNVARYAPYPDHYLEPPRFARIPEGVLLCTATEGVRIGIAQAQRTKLIGGYETRRTIEEQDRRIEEVLTAEAKRGRPLNIEKIVAAATSANQPTTDPGAAVARAVRRALGFDDIQTAHAQAWQRLWDRIGLSVAQKEIERPLRLHAFHILQTVSPHSADLDVGIPARGWTGEAYRGHIFWDELFVLPFLTARFPALARALLLYRYRRLGAARQAARDAGYRGAMYPWRSASDGREVTPRFQLNMLSGRWMPDHTHLQRHIGAAIAWNVWQYFLATGDAEFLADAGAEIILEVARFWASRVEHDPRDDRYHLRGVIGPDEYHTAYPGATEPGLDDNAYTNIMAVWTLCRACEVLDHLPARRRHELRNRLDLHPGEFKDWETISRRMYIPFHGPGIISQFEGFDRLKRLQPEMLPERLADQRIDWALDAIGEGANAYQVSKQADVLTVFYLLPPEEVCGLLARLGYTFDRAQLARNAAYYLERTTHRSSLSRIVYAGALAETDPGLSWELYREALGTDLHGLKGESTEEGVHLGAMGGTFDVLQRRYLGIAWTPDGLRIDPALPEALGPVRLEFQCRGIELFVESDGRGLRIGSEPGQRTAIRISGPDGDFLLAPGNRPKRFGM